MHVTMTKLPDGRCFPTYHGDVLSWSIGLYHTPAEESVGFPRMRTVIRAMLENKRQATVEMERREMLKASFDRVFGRNAKQALDVIESEIKSFRS